jgi:AraC-like DNA-binding protein
VQATVIYDALYSWAKHLKDLRHTQNPTDHILHEVYNKYLKLKKNEKKTPEWVRDFKEIIQDQIDLNLSLGLKEISSELKVHPAYLSREFARHFDNLSFGDYIRKLRIEKALKLIEETDYSLSEISYLTGFSDQSHFTRIFRKQLGISPSAHRKSLKSKKNTKG